MRVSVPLTVNPRPRDVARPSWCRWAPIIVAGAFIGTVFGTKAYASGSLYAFGDSLSDNGAVVRLTGIVPNARSTIFRAGRSSNGPVWVEYLPSLIGKNFDATNDYAINGALSGHAGSLNLSRPEWSGLPGVLDQVTTFIATKKSLAKEDLVTIWEGTNDQDLLKPYFNGIEKYMEYIRPTSIQGIVNYTVMNLKTEIESLSKIGGRQFVIPSLYDDNATRPGYMAYNSILPQVLSGYSSQGINIYYFDVSKFIDQIRKNPSAYGITHDLDVKCSSVPACASGTVATQNTYLTADGTHFMTSVHDYIARYIANEYNAHRALSTPISLGMQVSQFDLDAGMLQDLGSQIRELRPQKEQGYSMSLDVMSRSFSTSSSSGILGLSGTIQRYGATISHNIGQHLRTGITAAYMAGSGQLSGGGGSVGLHSYHLGIYGSFSRGRLGVNAHLMGGYSNYDLKRPGVMGDTLRSKLHGWDGEGYSRVSYYAVNVPHTLQFGPYIQASYIHTGTGAASEVGDPMLTQIVDSQSEGRALGETGLTSSLAVGSGEGLWLRLAADVAARRNFSGESRLVDTSLSYAKIIVDRNRVSQTANTYGVARATLDVAYADLGSVNVYGVAQFGSASSTSSIIGLELNSTF